MRTRRAQPRQGWTARTGDRFTAGIAHARAIPHRDAARRGAVRLLLQRGEVGDDVLDVLRGQPRGGLRCAFARVEAWHARLRIDAGNVDDAQAQLRRRNRNAAPTESAHEFGTTVDIAYRKFSPPMDDGTGKGALPLDARARIVSDSLWTLMARQRGVELQAVLGRVLKEMRREGKLVTRMERSQPVYHTTVAQPYPAPGPKSAQP